MCQFRRSQGTLRGTTSSDNSIEDDLLTWCTIAELGARGVNFPQPVRSDRAYVLSASWHSRRESANNSLRGPGPL